MSDQSASSPLEGPSLTVQRLAKLIRSGDDAPLHLAIINNSQFNRAARAVENAAPVEIRTERGFPQGAWKALLSTFPTSASLSYTFKKPRRKNYRARCIGHTTRKLGRDVAFK